MVKACTILTYEQISMGSHKGCSTYLISPRARARRRDPMVMECVADLNKVRLERVKQCCPAARIDGQAVVEGARQSISRQRANAAALDVLRLARDYD